MFITDKEIIAIAKQREIEFDAFCLINFVREKENGKLSIDDILDEYENLKEY